MAVVDTTKTIYRTADQIAQSIIDNIHATEPLWATEPGTPLRKIIDAFAQMLQQITLEAHIAQISFDLDAKSGAELDLFVALFGFERKRATKATGIEKFILDTPATNRILIAAGTRVATVATSINPSLGFLATANTVIEVGATQGEVPIIAETAGSMYDVDAGAILVSSGGFSGSVRNDVATTGGSDDESDESLRDRFRKTVFRNIAGTKAAYIGLAQTNDAVTTNRVAVYGQTERVEEVVQFSTLDPLGNPWGGGAIRAYLQKPQIYFDSEFVSPIDTVPTEGRIFYTRETDYVVLTDLTGTYLQTVGVGIPNNTRALVSYEYKSTASRADEFGNTRNVVDIYVGGSIRNTATDLANFDTSKIVNVADRLRTAITNSQTTIPILGDVKRFATAGTVLIQSEQIHYTNIDKVNNQLVNCTRGFNATVAATHAIYLDVIELTNRYFTKLMFQPTDELSDTIVQGVNIWYEGVDYKLLKDGNELGNRGSWRGNDLVAWERFQQSGGPPVPTHPVNGTQFRVDYVWDSLPKVLYDQAYTAPVRNITADVLVHSGIEIYFDINLALMYKRDANISDTNARIDSDLRAYIENLGFGSAIQLQDFIDIAYNTIGADNVRFIKSTEDALNHNIRIFDSEGQPTLFKGQQYQTNDFVLDDDQIPVLQTVNFITKAQNTW